MGLMMKEDHSKEGYGKKNPIDDERNQKKKRRKAVKMGAFMLAKGRGALNNC